MRRFWLLAAILAACVVQEARKAVAQPAHNATVLSFRIEDQMEAGRSYAVIAEVRNTGFTGWRAKDGFVLDCRYTGGGTTAGEAFNFEEKLKRDVPVGGRAQFTWRVEAPRTVGDYALSCSMAFKNRRFGRPLAETVTILPRHVALIDPTIPSRPVANSEHTLRVAVKNSGETNWPEGEYSLVGTLAQSPPDATDQERRSFAIEAELQDDWLYGKSDTITRPFTIPNTPGRYVWRLSVWQDNQPFAFPGARVDVVLQVVGGIQAEIRSVTIEKKMKAGRTYKMRVRVTNTGDLALPKSGWGFECESTPPKGARPSRDDFRFSAAAKRSLQPNATFEIVYDVEAPRITGDWELKIQLEHEGKALGRPHKVKVNVAA